MTLYETLTQEAAQAADLDAALALLSWDQEVMMAPGSAASRARQLGTLAALRHQRTTTVLKPLLDKLMQQTTTLSQTEALNVHQLHRSVTKAVLLPEAFVIQLTELASKAQHTWEQAKRTADFTLFAPLLTEMVALKRQEADYYGYIASPYDALLDSYEPGGTAAQLTTLFAALKPQLKTWIRQLAAAPQVDDSCLRQAISKERQWAFGVNVLKRMGYDFSRGRQDISMHPFSIGMGPDDVRITTHINEQDITAMLFSTVHEGGHALYEQGLSPLGYGLPLGEACSLSIHESQSRLWENIVARSLPFWESHFSEFAQLFPDGLKGKTALHVFQAVNRVEPSLIRIYADELTYHFHVILRFELEVELIEGRLEVSELPEAWAAKVKEYLGLTVPDAAHGVLQDVHWSHGSFGYFPTYSLGSFYAAQFYSAAHKAIPDLEAKFQAGNFAPLHAWLAANIYSQGRLYTSEELCARVSGEPLDVRYFLDYLRAKLDKVYGLHLQP